MSHTLNKHEILLGDPLTICWVKAHGVPNPHNLHTCHIDAGVDMHRHQIFTVQVSHNGGIHPARANSSALGTFDPFCPQIYFSLLKESEPGSLQVHTLPMATKNWHSREGQ